MTTHIDAATLLTVALCQHNPGMDLPAVKYVMHDLVGFLSRLDPDKSSETADAKLEELRTFPHRSIQNDKVVCLECGQEFDLLSNRHLAQHGITPKDYKARYYLPKTQPLSSKRLSRKRSRIAKTSKANAGLLLWQDKRRKEKAAARLQPVSSPPAKRRKA